MARVHLEPAILGPEIDRMGVSGDAAFVDLFSSLVQHGDPEGRSARYAHHLG